MSGRKIIFGDGSEIAGGECGFDAGILWCYNVGTDIFDVTSFFSDKNKTKKIVFIYGDQKDTYEGFTEILTAIKDYNGVVKIALREGMNNGS